MFSFYFICHHCFVFPFFPNFCFPPNRGGLPRVWVFLKEGAFNWMFAGKHHKAIKPVFGVETINKLELFFFFPKKNIKNIVLGFKPRLMYAGLLKQNPVFKKKINPVTKKPKFIVWLGFFFYSYLTKIDKNNFLPRPVCH